MRKRDEEQPLYMISIVSKMLNVHPQTLRLYEREGFIHPKRTKRQRLYSEKDVEQLNFILQLTRELGVNRAGVDIIIRLRHRMEILQNEMEEMMDLLEDELRRDFKERIRKAFKEE
ncbi:MAG: MerR family transcriptional regulator [Thermodesulfovibrionales bacterium]|jgi:MerR family transcriptional regulator/heat shock protein HspR